MSPVLDIEYMKFPVVDYSLYGFLVLDIWFMKFPVVDYSWCQSSIGHGMYEISSSGLFIKESINGVTCLVN